MPHEGLAGAPVRVGRLVLWPLTIGASEWLQEAFLMAPAGRDSLMVLSYAMAYARTPAALPRGMRYKDLSGMMQRWRRGLGLTMRELTEAVDVLMSRTTPTKAEKIDAEADPARVYADMVHSLCGAYPGTTPDYWRWGLSLGESLNSLAAYIKRESPKGKASALDPSVMAFRAFVDAKATIIRERRERAS
jgi:hypothetical protein